MAAILTSFERSIIAAKVRRQFSEEHAEIVERLERENQSLRSDAEALDKALHQSRNECLLLTREIEAQRHKILELSAHPGIAQSDEDLAGLQHECADLRHKAWEMQEELHRTKEVLSFTSHLLFEAYMPCLLPSAVQA